MPIIRELTPEELDGLSKQGIDPSPYIGQKVIIKTGEELGQQQAPTQQPIGSQVSIPGAATRTLKAHAGGLAGAGAGALGAQTLPGAHAFPPWTELGYGVVGALAGGYGGQKGQNVIQGEDITKKLQSEYEEAAQQHPITTEATDILAGALASGGSFKPSNIVRAGKALLGKNVVSAADQLAYNQIGKEAMTAAGAKAMEENIANQAALKNVAVQSAVMPAINTGIELATTGHMPTIGSLAMQAAGGAVMSGQNRLSKRILGNHEPIPEPTYDSKSGWKNVDVNDSTITEIAPRTSKYKETNKDGKYILDDTAIRSAFDDINPKPDTSKMSNEDALAAQTEWRRKQKLTATAKRDILHDLEIQKQQQADLTWEDKARNFWDNATDEGKRRLFEFNNTNASSTKNPTRLSWNDLSPREKLIVAQNAGVSTQPAATQQPEIRIPQQPTPTLSEAEKAKLGLEIKPVAPQQPVKPNEPLSEAEKYQLGLKAPPNVNTPEEQARIDVRKQFPELRNPQALPPKPLPEPPKPEITGEERSKLGLLPEEKQPLDEKGAGPREQPSGIDTEVENAKSVRTDEEKYNSMASRYPLQDDGTAFSKVYQKLYPLTRQEAEELSRLRIKLVKGTITPQERIRSNALANKQVAGPSIKPGTQFSTVGDALEHIIKSEYDPDAVELAKSLKIDDETKKVPIHFEEKGEGEDTLGTYYSQADRIDLTRKGIEHPDAHLVTLHEIVHAATMRKIPRDLMFVKGRGAKTLIDNYLAAEGGDENVKEILRCYLETARQLGVEKQLFGLEGQTRGAFQGVANDPHRASKTNIPHGYNVSDVAEFIAGIFDKPAFVTQLNYLKANDNTNRSMLSRIYDAIRKFIGMNVKQGSMLERVLKPIEQLTASERPKNYRELGYREPSFSERLPKENYATETGNNERNNIPEHQGTGELGKRTEASSSNRNAEGEETQGKKKVSKVRHFFQSGIERIQNLDHPLAGKLAGALQKTFDERQYLRGKWLNSILETADKHNLTAKDQTQLENIARYELENKEDAPRSMFRNQAQIAAYKAAKASLEDNFQYRLKNEEPVNRGGNPTLPKRDDHYWPTTLDTQVANDIRNNENVSKWKDIFTEYQDKLGEEDPEENWKSLVEALQTASKTGDVGNATHFNAARKAQGIPLPPEMTKKGFLKNLESYFHRQATDNSFYKHVESNPEVMSALGEKKDAWNRPIPESQNGVLANQDDVKAVMNELRGEIGGAGFHNEKSLSSIATTMFIGPGTTIHKLGSNLGNALTIWADNPRTLVNGIKSAITDYSKGLQHATENGVVKMTAKSVGDLFNGQLTVAERLQGMAKAIRGIYSLNDLTDKWAAGLMQAGSEGVLPSKILRANAGDKTQQALLKRLDPDYVVGKEYDEEGISKLATNLINNIHGTGDARTIPPWMTSDSEISGFFKLSNWSLSQTNRFYNDVWDPAIKHGDYKPLITALFGGVAAGYMIKELREKLQGKHGQIPSLAEIGASERGFAGNPGLLAYNAMAAASYSGLGGMLSILGKVPMDWAYKNSAQGMVFPLDELASDTITTLGQITTAIANDPNINWIHLVQQWAAHQFTTNFQLGRVMYNQAIDNGLITGTLAEKKELADKMGQLRRFKMTEGIPYNEVDAAGNPFMNIEQKRFKMEQDPEKIVEQLPQLVNNIMEKYGNKPDVMMSKLKALKENQYATFPDVESMPLSFMKYLSYLTRMEGEDKAQEALRDYLRHKAINTMKAEAVP